MDIKTQKNISNDGSLSISKHNYLRKEMILTGFEIFQHNPPF